MVVQSEYFKFTSKLSETVFICLGNPDRADDAVGIEIGLALKNNPELKVYIESMDDIDTALLNALEDNNISKIVIIDAADFDSIPGSFIVTSSLNDKIRVLSTHSFPIHHWEDLIKQHNKTLVFIGIQVKNVDFMSTMSEEVRQAKEKIINLIKPIKTGK